MEPPLPPNEADCCNSGCNPCILDIYEEQLKRYKANTTSEIPKLKNCLSQTSYAIFKLTDKIRHTNDTYFLIFEYHKPYRDEDGDRNDLGLYYKPGQHLLLRVSLHGDPNHFTRAYTPIPHERKKGPLTFAVLAKIYETGMMSGYLRNIKVSSQTLWRGPYCDFEISYRYRWILMVAQGTGIAPLYAVTKEMLDNDECETFLTLYFSCRSCEDILLRDELRTCSSHWNFKYEAFVSGEVNKSKARYNEVIHPRRLNRSDIVKYLADKEGAGDVRVLICGSDAFSADMSEGLGNLKGVDVFVF